MVSVWRGARFLLVIVVLVAAVWFGVMPGINSLRGAGSIAQRAATVFQVIHGLSATAALWAFLTRQPWLRAVLGLWTLTITATGTLAPIVWAGAGWATGALGGAATAAVATLVSWGAWAHCRDRPPLAIRPGRPPTSPSSQSPQSQRQ